jgi:copper oxidase (laccase) domain-containing protein
MRDRRESSLVSTSLAAASLVACGTGVVEDGEGRGAAAAGERADELHHLELVEEVELLHGLGPGIGPRQFAVGADVLQAFGADRRFFTPRPRPDGQSRWLADLPGLARQRLLALGLHQVAGGHWCTVETPSDFFSFRRDGVTGRMAAAVWLRG